MGTILFFICVGFLLGVLLFVLAKLSEIQAKGEAKQILMKGTIENPRQLKKIMGILGTTPNDLEAKHLWRKLQSLNEKQTK